MHGSWLVLHGLILFILWCDRNFLKNICDAVIFLMINGEKIGLNLPHFPERGAEIGEYNAIS